MANDICVKLIHRHPHVFGDVFADTPEKVLSNWEKIKSEEKERVTVTDKLKAIPPMLPALMRAQKVGKKAACFDFGDKEAVMDKVCEELCELNEATLEKIYPTKVQETAKAPETFNFEAKSVAAPAIKCAKPRVLIPVFPGTNCEYDSARAVVEAGGIADIAVIRNLTADDVARSVEDIAARIKDSQIIFIPGGFSGGDEPDGSAKFITAFFRNPAIKAEVSELLDSRDGLMCGICNGFQALIKLGLVPYGKIIDTDENCPTLTYNTIARHQSKIVRTRIASNMSPWLQGVQVGDIINVAISHGEGRFLASDELVAELKKNGQIATQYVDLDGNPTMDTAFNPNGSVCAIEGITSPDGRVFGKMGHSERIGAGLYKNVAGQYDIRMFESAVKYFK